ncbi:MAG: serine--tRNA ligase [Candidatus Bathyarchaeia archaeon]|nr:serine--tRNA ligase [Candidatus Bathyarchaeota archaeon]
MLDLRFIRENPIAAKKDLEKRGEYDKIQWIDEIIEYDKRRRDIIQELNRLRHMRNLLTDEIAKLKREGLDVSEKLAEANKIPDEIKALEKSLQDYEGRLEYRLSRLPNITHETVPPGRDESDNVVVRVWGEKPQFSFEPRDHIDLGLKLDLIDVERAAKVSGARFAYLKHEAALLEFAIVRYALEKVVKDGFIPVIPPVLVKKEAMYGAGFLPLGEDDIYWIMGEDLCLAGTAEVPLAAMHMGEVLDEERLPLYYAGFSTCFRTEAGAHGRDTKGIFRVHQFDKLELFKFTTPETSWEEHEKLIATVEKIYRGLNLHYRIVNICSGELGASAAKKYDLEVWLPGQGKYREVVSCSNCTDYQARRLNIRCRKGLREKPRFVHTLNSTAVAVGRLLVAIFENYQCEDGSIRVPDALTQYLGFKEITMDKSYS